MRGLSAEHKAERQKGLGGSDAKRVMDGEWRQLWLEKTGRAEPEGLDWVIPVQIGHCTEQFNAEYFEHVTGRPVGRRGDAVVSAAHPFMRANLDGITTTASGHGAYWDAKHVGRADERMVLRYTPQMTHCATILGLDYWVLSVLIGNSKHEIVEQEVDPFYAQELIAKEREFWSYVERDEEPRDRIEPSLPPAPERRLRNIDLNGHFGTPEWERMVEQYNWAAEVVTLIGDFIATVGPAARYAITGRALKSAIPDDVGELRRGAFLFTRNKIGSVTMKLDAKGKSDG